MTARQPAQFEACVHFHYLLEVFSVLIGGRSGMTAYIGKAVGYPRSHFPWVATSFALLIKHVDS